MCPSGRSVVCHGSRRLGRQTPKRTDCRLDPKFTGWKDGLGQGHGLLVSPVELRVVKRSLTSRSHTGSRRTPDEPPAFQQVQRLSRLDNICRLDHVRRLDNVHRLDNVYHQSSDFDVQIVKRSMSQRF